MKVVYLSCQEVAKITGVQLRTVWEWCRTGKIKATRPTGKQYMIAEKDFKAFIADGQNKSKEE